MNTLRVLLVLALATGSVRDQGSPVRPDQSPALARCAEAAAAWWHGKVGIGFDDIDPKVAIPLCQAATVAEPAAPDAWAFLARAFARAERYPEMLAAIERAVAGGSTVGQWYRGVAYERGYGVPQNAAEAAKWYRMAADAGQPNAMLNLGAMYADERVPAANRFLSEGQAVKWLRQAADLGFAEAQFELGVLYEEYHAAAPPPIDDWPSEAVRWLRLAAAQDHAGAEYRLGVIFAEGKHDRGDHEEAYSMLVRALHSKDPELRKDVVGALVALGSFQGGSGTHPPLAGGRVPITNLDDADQAAITDVSTALENPTSPASLDALIRLIQHSNVRFQRAAGTWLLRSGDRRAVPLLVSALKANQGNAATLQPVIDALLAFGDLAEQPLLDAARAGPPAARAASLLALPKVRALNTQSLDVLTAGLRDSDATVRAAAATALGETADERAVEPLIAALSDRSYDVRSNAIEALVQLCDRRAIPSLIKTIDDPSPAVRDAGIGALGTIGDARAVEPLVKALAARVTRSGAISALKEIGDARAVEPLIGLLDDKESRAVVAAALARIGDPRAVRPLTARLNSSAPEDQAAIVEALGRLGGETAAAAIATVLRANAKLWKDVGDLATTPDLDVRRVLHSFLRDPNPEVRKRAIDLLADNVAHESLEAFAESLHDSDAHVRQKAANALMWVRDPAAIDPLLEALKDPDRSVRDAATEALFKYDDPRIVPPLIERLRDERSIAATAAIALRWLRDPRATEPLVALARSTKLDNLDREIIAQALGEIGDPRGADLLLAWLDDPDAQIQAAVVDALGNMKDSRAVDRLVAMLGRASLTDSLRLAILKALGHLQDARSVEVLLPFAQSGPVRSRVAAARALHQLGDARGASNVVSLAGDPALDTDTLDWLGTLGDRRAVAPLLDRLDRTNDASGPTNSIFDALSTLVGLNDPRLVDRLHRRPALGVPVATFGKFQPGMMEYVRTLSEHVSDAVLMGLVRATWWWPSDEMRVDPQVLAAELHLSNGSVAGDAPALNPYSCFVAAKLSAANDLWKAVISFADRGLAGAPARQATLRVALAWLKAEGQWHTGSPEAALAVLDDLEKNVLPQVKALERAHTDLPFQSYTSVLRAAVLFAANRPSAALDETNRAERLLRFEGDDVSEFVVDDMRRRIGAYRVGAKTATALEMLREAAAEAPKVQAMFAQAPATTAFDRDAERVLMEGALKSNIALAAQGNRVALQTAQFLAEQLQLKSLVIPSNVHLANSARQDAADQIRAQKDAIADIDRQIRTGSSDTGTLNSAAPGGEGAGPLQARRNKAIQKLNDVVTGLQRTHPEVTALLAAEPTDLRLLQPRITPQMRIVQYVLTEDQGWAFVIGPDDLQVVDLPNGRRTLGPLVQRYRRLLETASDARGVRVQSSSAAPAGDLLDASRTLARDLIEPLSARLDGVTSLLIVPNGPLHQLPFAALPWRNGYLIQAFDLRFLTGSSLLAAVSGRPAIERDALILGNPTAPDARWPPLPEAEAEANDIAKLLPNARTLIGPAASRRALVDQDLNGRLVHLAIHGQAGMLEDTRLVLSDGYLTVKDVWGLALEGSPLVVLSACETALGEQLSSDRVVSLADGFFMAGSRAVIASLWSVADASTRELMTTFYRKRADGDAKALAEAQRALIEKGYGPYHWAAFTFSGW